MNFGKLSAVLLAFTLLCVDGSARTAEGPASTNISDVDALLPMRSRPLAYVSMVPNPPKPHAFWDRKNLGLFSGIAVMRALDYTSTINMQSRGREEILLPDDVVNNRAGFAALEAAGAATSMGLSYLLHTTGHHKLERWLSIGHVSVTGFGVVRNYSLESKHPTR